MTELLSNRPEADVGVADSILTRLIRPSTLKGLLTGEPLDMAEPRSSAASPVARRLRVSARRARLLGESGQRRRLLDRLSRTQVDIAPLVWRHLADDRWYVQRNMLMLLERAARIPEGFSAAPWVVHDDPRVRSEAIRLQLTLPYEREEAIVRALKDLDPRVVHVGLTAIRHACPPQLLAYVIDLALDADLDDDIRTLAVNVVARVQRIEVLEAFLELSDGGRSLLGRLRLPLKTPVLVAVIRALADTWAFDDHAAVVLTAAPESPDPDLRAAVSPTTT